MTSKVYSLLGIFLILSFSASAQFTLTGTVKDASVNKPIAEAEVFNKETNYLQRTNQKGEYTFKDLEEGTYTLVVFVAGYNPAQQQITITGDSELNFALEPYSIELSEVVINQKREEAFSLNRLNPVEGTAIYAGKKSEVVLLDQTVGNLAANNARQIYSQVVGLNIYENGDAGLQLNIGGRGLDPNRTANFNTRQNGYDISADVLGYPESYYTPPAEALSEIQVIRGAASLQYGTQFGGLINFKLRRPNPVKKLEWVSRQTYGSYNLFTSFNSLSGTVGKFSYYTYFNYKQGDGFRPNSEFDSKNFFASLNYALSDKTDITLETTYLKYLAQQAGGLTDSLFNADPTISTRERNWFEVDWRLIALKLKHKFSSKTDFSLNLFGLDAERNSVGFRGNPKSPQDNPVDSEYDPNDITRDLIKGKFQNWGAEARLLNRYVVKGKDAVFLIGAKYYQSQNTSRQGPSSNGFEPDFEFANDQHPSYPNQSDFEFPNLNLSLFGENILFINEKLSITPGFRIEHIKTESIGEYTEVRYDLAGNEIFRKDTTDNRVFDRNLLLLGLGASYNYSNNLEVYGNISQNYRSVTFSDIRVVSPTFSIDPTITDEEGFTADLGVRGKWNKLISYDISTYALKYNDRIGTVLVSTGPDKGSRIRKNIGDALIYGVEAFIDWNLINTLRLDNYRYRLSPFVNIALTDSEYIKSDENNVEGKKVEFIPRVNLKTGVKFGYKNLLGNLQYIYLSKQYNDAENNEIPEAGDSREGVIGPIPSYGVLDLSMSYKFRKFKLEAGINNLLDEKYFTRRATGYPGPGIIPAEPRTYYATLEFRL
ncbi:TonB-dependent receptor [Fulvivirga sp. RKSG066]|uniref:TonB-dependent receptor n=1 Tax=Fulvivirga aurantia TaxID=2529383 RepID=UPI0012BC21BD|nr:TonB-dependent receptor [Fulvivirga aurantia]MTI21063.1 TonB-dependent receptor [Fulvivirga aurantia]